MITFTLTAFLLSLCHSQNTIVQIANITVTSDFDLDLWIQFENHNAGSPVSSLWHPIGAFSAGKNRYNISIIDIVNGYTGHTNRLRLGAFGDSSLHSTRFKRIYMDDKQGSSGKFVTVFNETEMPVWDCDTSENGCCIFFWSANQESYATTVTNPCNDTNSFESYRAPTSAPTIEPTLPPTDPTSGPTLQPSIPTIAPTWVPTSIPSNLPTVSSDDELFSSTLDTNETSAGPSGTGADTVEPTQATGAGLGSYTSTNLQPTETPTVGTNGGSSSTGNSSNSDLSGS